MTTQNKQNLAIIPNERIVQSIFVVRRQKVMLDSDLASLYGVETKVLNQTVRRNLDRFPDDFMFQLTTKETENLRSQIVTSSGEYGGRRYAPLVFTEHGILMLSSVLKSKRAIQVNIQIVRMFIKLREMLSNYKDVKEKIETLEKKYDSRFKIVFDTLKQQPAFAYGLRRGEVGFAKK